jgi:hypothetical protein
MQRTYYQRYRAVSLANIIMLRMMVREGRQAGAARQCIKEAQRNLAAHRRLHHPARVHI